MLVLILQKINLVHRSKKKPNNMNSNKRIQVMIVHLKNGRSLNNKLRMNKEPLYSDKIHFYWINYLMCSKQLIVNNYKIKKKNE